jgi:hypothetical protein
MAFEVHEDRFCLKCMAPVLWDTAETPGDDYAWQCSNATCVYGAIPEGTGDMDYPDWTVSSDQLTTARETDPQTIVDTLTQWITDEEDKRQTLNQASAATRARYQGLLLSYESRIRRLAVQRQIFEDVVEEGQPWNYPVILAWQLHR